MTEARILMSGDELSEVLDNRDWVVIDCRFELADPDAGRRSYAESHIPGAVYLDLDEDLAGPIKPGTGRHPLPEVTAISAKLGELGIDNGHKVLVYDGGNGALAARAWWILRWLGHRSVFLLDGGISHWLSLDKPVDAEEVNRPSTTYSPRADNALVLTTAELAADLDAIAGINLCDARDRARFLGEQEPIDPIAGHIPGARNLPLADFLNPDGTWRPLVERRALLERALGRPQEAVWSVMCGSGVTACHLAISGIEAGFTEPRLYVGSWSEWIRNPNRPIGIGEAGEKARRAADLA